MAVYELTLSTTYFGQRCLNRWNYISSGTPATVQGSFGLASAFGGVFALQPPDGSVLDLIKDITVNTVTYDQIYVRNLYDVQDFYESPFPSGVVGSSAAEGQSPALANGFRTSRVRTDVRRGFKRIVGIGETGTAPGGVIIAAWKASMQLVADAMSAAITYDDEGNTLSYSPAILKRELYTPPSGKPAYRYYATEAEQLANSAVGFVWEVQDTVRTQGSRQYGRGQ